MKNIPHSMLSGVACIIIQCWVNKDLADFTKLNILKQWGLKMEEFVTRHSTIMDKYDPAKKIVQGWRMGRLYNVEAGTNPGFYTNKILCVMPWLVELPLNIFNNHADRVRVLAQP
jgi:alpha-N-arabinofuranosidase